jgi:hypothetical protein
MTKPHPAVDVDQPVGLRGLERPDVDRESLAARYLARTGAAYGGRNEAGVLSRAPTRVPLGRLMLSHPDGCTCALGSASLTGAAALGWPFDDASTG